MAYCVNCGNSMVANARFCPKCGIAVVSQSPKVSAAMVEPNKAPSLSEELSWDIKIKLLFNPIIWKDFVKVWGISIGLLTYLVLIALVKSGNNQEIILFLEIMAAMFAGFMLLTFTIMLAMFYNGLPTYFKVDSEGIYYKMTSSRASFATKVVVVGGALAGSASTVGSGLLAQSGQEGFFPWASIAKLKRKNNGGAISVYNSWRQVLVMYCKKEDCDAILNLSQAYLAKSLQTDIQDRADYAKMHEWTFSGIKTLFWAIFGTGLLFLYPPLSSDEPFGLIIPGAIILLGGFARRYLKIMLMVIGFLVCLAFIALFAFEDMANISLANWKYPATGLGFLVLIITSIFNLVDGVKQTKIKKT